MKPYSEIGRGKIYHGDCFDILPTFKALSYDLIVTDPPYNFTTASAGAGKLNPWADLVNSARWFSTWYSEAMRLLSLDGALWTFCNWRSLPVVTKAAFDIGHQIESVLVWDKCWIGPGGKRGLRPSYELVCLICNPNFKIKDRGLYDIQRFKWSSRKPTGHPAEKPSSLIRWLIQISSASNVADFFLGSGTTAVICEELGIKWTGIELSEEWCKKATVRIEQESKQIRPFVV